MAAYVEDFTELGTRLKDPLHTYSAGMRAKLSFAVSLAIEFDCYLIAHDSPHFTQARKSQQRSAARRGLRRTARSRAAAGP
jgi:ABC-type polysaccharide/polyol phosphate transport system ATPase subunit